MRQWKSLVALHAAAPSCFPHPPTPSPCPSPPREGEEADAESEYEFELKSSSPPPPSPRRAEPQQQQKLKEEVVRLVCCDGRVRSYRPPVTARELMQQHPRHLVCRADALLIGEKLPALAPAQELQPGQAYFLLPAHLFRSVLSFVSLASSLLLLLSSSTGSKGGKAAARPFEVCRTASGTLQIKFSDDFLVGEDPDEAEAEAEKKKKKARPAVLRGDERLEKEYEELVGYSKSRRWAPKLEPIEEVVVPIPAASAAAAAATEPSSPSPTAVASSEKRKSRGLPFLGRLGSRRHRRDSCNGGSAVACSG